MVNDVWLISQNRRNGLGDDDEDESSEEEDVDDIDKATPTINIGSLKIDDPEESSEEESEEEDIKPAPKKTPIAAASAAAAATNPNRAPQRGAKVSDLGADNAPRMSRREKEQADKAAAKERYWKLHEQGKTDEAKADMARLKKIRAEREAAAAARKAEADEKAAAAKAKLDASGKRR